MKKSFLMRVTSLLCLLLLFSTVAWAGGHATHYGKVTVSFNGNGSVYIGTSNTATSGKTEEKWQCDGSSGNDSKTYYLFAKPDDGYAFGGWYDIHGNLVTPTPDSFQAESESSTNPTTWSYTARFFEQSNSYTNPVTSLDCADPSLIKGDDGYFYMYSSEKYSGQGIPVWRSADLVEWEQITSIFAQRPENVTYTFLWAPEIAKVGDKYVLFYANAEYGNEASTQICVATSDHPYGPFTNNKILVRAHDSNYGAINANVDNCIDPSLFRDDDGKNYLIWGSWKGIYYIELDEACTSIKSGASKQNLPLLSGNYGDWKYVEAPMIYKKNGYYYLICSKGQTVNADNANGITYKLVVARSTSLHGTYLNFNNQDAFGSRYTTTYALSDLLQKNDYVLGPGHCSQIFLDEEGTEYIAYHGYSKTDGNWDYPGPRKLFIDKVKWHVWNSGEPWPWIDPYDNGAFIAKPTLTAPVPPTTHYISNAQEWMAFAQAVNDGNIFDNAVLTADIDMSGVDYTPFGSVDYSYHGTIEGNGHCIKNLTINTTNGRQGLIGTAGGGVKINNLIIDGSCDIHGGQYTGGFIGRADGAGEIHFTNCGNEAHIKGGQNTAGFIGCSSGVAIYWENCFNTGDIDGAYESAAFSGWGGDKLMNCWNTGRIMGSQEVNGKFYSLVRGDINNNVGDNYRYTWDLNGDNHSNIGIIDGYNLEWLANGHLAWYLNHPIGGEANNIWREDLLKDAHPLPQKHAIVYEGNICGTSDKAYTNNENQKVHRYTYTLTTTQLSCQCSCGDTYNDTTIPVEDGWLMLENAAQLAMAMDYVENGGGGNQKYKLVRGIDFTDMGNRMFGRDEDGKRFTGEFDGQYNTITVNYNDSRRQTALFSILDGAKVSNLYVDGNITMQNYNLAGGIFATATNAATVDQCISEVNYHDLGGHDATFGGIGANTYAGVKITNCAFRKGTNPDEPVRGTVKAERAYGNGGILGWADAGNASIENCYVTADITWNGGENIARNNPNIVNCYYYGNDHNNSIVTDGQLCHNLNGGDQGQDNIVWYQTIENESRPEARGYSPDFFGMQVFHDEDYYNIPQYIDIKASTGRAHYATFSSEKPVMIPRTYEGTNVRIHTVQANETGVINRYDFDEVGAMIGSFNYVPQKVGVLISVDINGEETEDDAYDPTVTYHIPYYPIRPNSGRDNLYHEYEGYNWLNPSSTPMSKFTNHKFYKLAYYDQKAPDYFDKHLGFFYGAKDGGAFNSKSGLAYLAVPNSTSDVKYSGFLFYDSTGTSTGVSAADALQQGDVIIYNLQGQRVSAPQKGIYIVNGKKVLF